MARILVPQPPREPFQITLRKGGPGGGGLIVQNIQSSGGGNVYLSQSKNDLMAPAVAGVPQAGLILAPQTAISFPDVEGEWFVLADAAGVYIEVVNYPLSFSGESTGKASTTSSGSSSTGSGGGSGSFRTGGGIQETL